MGKWTWKHCMVYLFLLLRTYMRGRMETPIKEEGGRTELSDTDRVAARWQLPGGGGEERGG